MKYLKVNNELNEITLFLEFFLWEKKEMCISYLEALIKKSFYVVSEYFEYFSEIN